MIDGRDCEGIAHSIERYDMSALSSQMRHVPSLSGSTSLRDSQQHHSQDFENLQCISVIHLVSHCDDLSIPGRDDDLGKVDN